MHVFINSTETTSTSCASHMQKKSMSVAKALSTNGNRSVFYLHFLKDGTISFPVTLA